MIKINLAGKNLHSSGTVGLAAGEGITIGGLKLPSLGQFMEPEMLSLLRKIALPIVVAILGNFSLEQYKSSELERMDQEIQGIRAQAPALEAEVTKLKVYEQVRVTLEEDERTIRTKVETIEKLISGRANTAKFLLSIGTVVPKDVWLTEIGIRGDEVAINGMALGMSNVSDFMRGVQESAFVADLNLKNSQQTKVGESGEVTSFELTAKKK